MSFPIREHKHAYLPVMMPSSSSSADVRVLWIEPTHDDTLGGLLEPDTNEGLLIDRPAAYALATFCKPALTHRRPEPGHSTSIQWIFTEL